MKINHDFTLDNKNGFNGKIPLKVAHAFEIESRGIVDGRLSLHFDFENGQLINLDAERNKRGLYNDK